MVWVYATKNGILTGTMDGLETEERAKDYINRLRNARDNYDSWKPMKNEGYDWHLVEFVDNKPRFTY